jgi:hypothetical protein
MVTLAPGKFRVTIAGEDRTVIVSFGVRGEILRMITKKQLEYRGISSQNMLPPEMRAKLAAAVEALDVARQTKNERPEPPAEDADAAAKISYATASANFPAADKRIDELQEEVNHLYEESIKTIDANRDRITEALTVGMIDLTDDAVAEILALLLTRRDATGQVIEQVTKTMVLHGETYVEAGDELLDLIEGTMEYLTAAIKKISAVSQMVSSLVRPD